MCSRQTIKIGGIIDHDELYDAFLVRLKRAREDAGLTQAQAAARLNKSQSYVSKCERGELKVDVIELLAFASVYGKSLVYFVDKLENDKTS